MTFEYKVVPAPTRGRKAKGVKTPADRFAHALEMTMNDLAEAGWEYQRTDTLPAEERQGLTGRTTVYQNMLVFRREIGASADIEPKAQAAPAKALAAPTEETEPEEPSSKHSLDTMIANELAAARAPKLPSAETAQETPGTPVKAPKVSDKGGKDGVAAE